MNIKVGIVDIDDSFSKRFSSLINEKYEKIEVFVFPDISAAKKAASKSVLNLLLLDDSKVDEISMDDFNIPNFKIVFLTKERKEIEGPILSVCKYMSMEEWYLFICHNCISEVNSLGGDEDYFIDNKTCLFLSSSAGFGASDAAIEFCRFLKNKGKLVFGICPYLESGETIWKSVEQLSKGMVIVMVLDCLSDIQLAIPFINSNVVVLVSDGKDETNKNIKGLLKGLPGMLCTSSEEIFEKTYLLYKDFDPQTSNLLVDDRLGKLGGLDTERNCKAAFEKLETILGV